MTDHLPECTRWFTDMPAPDECPACEMFRACEVRVRDEFRSTIHACPPAGSGVMPCCGRTPFEVLADRMTSDPAFVNCTGGRGFASGWRLGVGDGYRKGVRAARDVVAALYANAGKYAQDMIDPDDALAAIDALRGES